MNPVYDVFIIGAGQAGIPLAHSLARAGRRVALAEHQHLGGSCVNYGCTPTKAAIASARLAHLARRATEFGLKVPTVEIDFAAVLRRAREMAVQSRTHLDESFRLDNPRLIRAHARFVGRDGDRFRLTAGAEEFLAREVVLDTGTRTSIPPIEGIGDIEYIDSESWLDRAELPQHLLMMGGGYIGLEMGQFYRRMGSAVTVIQSAGQIAGHEDADVAHALQNALQAEGIRFHLNANARRFRRTPHGVTATIAVEHGEIEIDASHVFLAAGRTPNTGKLGLDAIGLDVSDKGIVYVDDRLRTRIGGVWAAGDIRGGPMFTHTSWDDYRILESQMIGDGSRTLKRVVPYALFTDPELGRVGMTERQAREAGLPVKVARFEMRHNSKARELGESGGFIKVVVDGDTERLLGAAVLATEGAELVHLYVGLMNADLPYGAMERAIHIHPTLAEALQSAVASLRTQG